MKIVVLDTETTGLDQVNDEPVSIAMIDGDGGVIVDALVKPIMNRSWIGAQRIHGISPEDVKDSPYIAQFYPTIEKAIEEADLVVGYNLQFDLSMLHQPVEPSKQFDVMREFAKVHGQIRSDGSRKWSKLTECAAHYGYEFPPHGALEDCKATLFCYNSLMHDKAYLALKKKEEGKIDLGAGGYCLKTAIGLILSFGGIVTFLMSFMHIFDGTMLAWIVASLIMMAAGYFAIK